MRKTAKAVAVAPSKLTETLMIGLLVALLAGFTAQAAIRHAPHAAPAPQLSSIDK